MDEAFTRYRPVASNNENRNASGGKGKGVAHERQLSRVPSPPKAPRIHAPTPIPLTSETETDDSGITLIPRRLQDQSRRGSNPSSRAPQDIRAALKYASSESSDSPDTVVANGSGSNTVKALKLDSQGTPESKASTPRLVGQTITESELIQRRRMQDAHLFGQK